ncbi:MAG: TetR/AcrR family transcriptional regulator [Bacteroidales bacterium]|nr:TetR/AcrR family transcriptional regulator [Bacteroidales bacterium]
MSKRATNNSEQAILKAAEEEFLECGYDGARTTSIAERAGVTHSMLHYFFRTKEQLFERILLDKFSLVAESVLLIFGDTSMPLRERLEKGISQYFDFIAANPGLPRFMVNEIDNVETIIEGQLLPRLMTKAMELQKELDIDVRHLLLEVLSLNIFPFLGMPLVEKAFGDIAREELYERIKQENITVILKRLGL